MKLINTTKISDELIKAIAEDVGLDLRGEGILEVNYSAGVKSVHDGENGSFYQWRDVLCVSLRPDARTSTLAHELRHAAQCQMMGKDVFDAVYEAEMETVGYEENVLERDAREAGDRWRV